MFDASQRVEELVRTRTRADLDADWVTAFAFIKAVELVGEAASKLSRNFRDLHPSVDWRGLVELRKHLIHDYLSFDLDRAWEFAILELPPIMQELRRIVAPAEE